MANFRFSLEVLLELRRKRQEEKALLLAEACCRLEDSTRARSDLEAARGAALEGIGRAHRTGSSVGELRTLDHLVSRLDVRIREADEQCTDARARTDVSREQFHGAVAEHQSVLRLRNRHHEEWHAEENRSEQKLMDELSVPRHARGERPTPEGAKP